jgi:hypothetical protein
MKKLFTLIAIAAATLGNAQTPTAPIIEGTYYPVRNTSIKQVWDTTTNMSVPATGTNITWDYTIANGKFINICDTFSFKFIDPTQTPYNGYFPTATHATFVRTPFANPSDSLYNYWQVNYNGLFNQGGFCVKHAFDSTIVNTPQEFFSPTLIGYLDSYTDTVHTLVWAKRFGNQKVKIKERKIKTLTYDSWGTLKLPNGTYGNVARVKEKHMTNDSVFVDWASNNNYTFFSVFTATSYVHHFFRNNTFGSAYLMYLSANSTNTVIDYGWYTMPVDFGSISGSVFTSTTETTPITSGEAYLYRENSNFVRQDILAKAKIDALGNYKFDSIPYGIYRIAIRPDETMYPNSMITYYGDTTNWMDAQYITTTTLTSTGHKVHVKFHPTPTGSNNIHGQLMLNLGIQRSANVLSSNPIPGVGIVVKRNPGSSTARTVITDSNGDYNLGSLEDGGYKLFVDIPGMHMTGTYTFNVSGTSSVTGLDYIVGTDSIHPAASVIGIREIKNSVGGFMNAFPNPYTNISTINLNLPAGGDMNLEVYNLLGAKVATLDKGTKHAGTYSYTFGAKKIGYSAGIYIIKLTVGNKTDVIKIVEQ